MPATKATLDPARAAGRHDRVLAALGNALDTLVSRGETVEVSPTRHNVTTGQLFDLARDVRHHADISIAWVESGALTYVLPKAA